MRVAPARCTLLSSFPYRVHCVHCGRCAVTLALLRTPAVYPVAPEPVRRTLLDVLAETLAQHPDEAAVDAGGVPGDGGMLVWALPERPASLDPLYTETGSEQLVARQVHEPLVAELTGPFEDARRVPGLALSALPSSDRTVWRLRLRTGVRFQDGTPFSASAVSRTSLNRRFRHCKRRWWRCRRIRMR